MKRSESNKKGERAKVSAFEALAEALRVRRAQYTSKLKRHWEEHDKSPMPAKSR